VSIINPQDTTITQTGAGSAALDVEVGAQDVGDVVGGVRARGYWEGIWLRLRRDRLAVAGGIFIIVLFVVAFAGAPLAAKILGHGPNDIFPVGGIDSEGLPAGP
jgi:hypothetical protein